MTVTYAITFQVVPDQRTRFLTLLTALLDRMKTEPMYRAAVLHQDPGSENRFLLWETWADHQDVLDVQLHRPYRQDWHVALPDLLEGAREIGIWMPVKADGHLPVLPEPAPAPHAPAPSDSRSRPFDRRPETAFPGRVPPG